MVRPRKLVAPVLLAALLVVTASAAGLANHTSANASTTNPATVAAGQVGALAATAGCGRAPGLNSGTHTIQSGGKSRSFILRLPANYNQNNPYRLVFGFHWLGGSAVDVDTGQTVQRDVWSYYGLRQLANNTTIFVAPQGLNNGWANSGGEDVTFVDDMLRQLEANLCIETSLRFALGFSYGGGMSYALACARPNVFRAVAVYAGGQISGCSGGTGRIAYLGAHGINDSVLNISGGRSLRDRFVGNNGCTRQNAPEPSSGSLRHITTDFSGCAAGYPVRWIAFDGGHIAAPQDGAQGDSGSRTWLPAETWNFFSQFGGNTTPTPIPSPTGPTPTPSPIPTPTSTPPPSPTSSPTNPGGGACQVTAKVNAWNNGLTQEITITNTGGSAINGWSLVFTLPGGQNITGGWNASYSPTSGQVTARNVSYNGNIAPGASVSIGFQATHTGNSDRPSSYALNGANCTVA